MAYHAIPKGGAKTYMKTVFLEDLCTTNMWKCTFETLQREAKARGWDVLRKQYWEEKMLSILIDEAVVSDSAIEAERCLKALRSKSVLRGYDQSKLHETSKDKHFEEAEMLKDLDRLGSKEGLLLKN